MSEDAYRPVHERTELEVTEADWLRGLRRHLDTPARRAGMTLTELAERVGVSIVNLSILKNDRAKAVRFSTLAAICEALDCRPGDVLSLRGRP